MKNLRKKLGGGKTKQGVLARRYVLTRNLRAALLAVLLTPAVVLSVICLSRLLRTDDNPPATNWGTARAFSEKRSAEQLLAVYRASHAAFNFYVKRDRIAPSLKGLEHAFDNARSEADLAYALQVLVNSSGDKHAEVMTRLAYDDAIARLEGKQIGVELEFNYSQLAGAWLVSKCPLGSSADQEGLSIDDELVSIDDEEIGVIDPTGGSWQARQKIAERLSQGELGSTVKVVVRRDNMELEANVRRIIVGAQSQVSSFDAFGSAGAKQIRVQSLVNPDVVPEITTIVSDLAKAEGRGLIIDLRSVQGGDGEAAVRLAALFMEKGIICHRITVTPEGHLLKQTWEVKGGKVNCNTSGPYAVKSDGSIDLNPQAAEKVEVLDWPCNVFSGDVVLVVDQDTLGAAEVVVAALKQDIKRAVVVGYYWTGGKGLSQTYFPVGPDYVLGLSTGFYLQPDGQSIEENGVEPQIGMPPGVDAFMFGMQVLQQRLNAIPKPELPPTGK
jgi:C-terminal processing protease CtpA/Prc